MKLLGTIRASDVFEDAIDKPDESYVDIRQTVRLALLDGEGRFGFVMYPKRPGFPQDYYGFLGGGVHEGETHLEALCREAKEEIGCKIKDIVELGLIKEFGIDQAGQAAESHCYFARVDGAKGSPSYDEKEAEGGAQPAWLNLGEAMVMYEKQVPGFSKHRARIIFTELTHRPDLLSS